METFRKSEKLCSRKIIEQVFKKNQSVTKFPLRIIYSISEMNSDFPVQIAFAVPKKKIKQAVKRNRIKRQLREIYRKRKNDIYQCLERQSRKLAVIVIFLDNKPASFYLLKKSFEECLESICEK